MATTYNASHIPTSEMLHKIAKEPALRTTAGARPLSTATEIYDTDFESDSESDFDKFDGFSRMSSGSLVADSVTTASTPRDAPTPDPAALSSYHFNINDRPVMGPNGPHLFRSSMASDDFNTTLEVDLILEKTPTATVPLYDNTSMNPRRKDTPLPGHDTAPEYAQEHVSQYAPEYTSRYSSGHAPQMHTNLVDAPVAPLDEVQVKSWSPPDVVRWMREVGFDESVVEKFYANDISGSILLDLQPEDLKELDIRSFGKRRHLMNSIKSLRDSFVAPNPDRQASVVSISSSQDQVSDCQCSSDSASMITKDGDKNKKHRKRHNRAHKKEATDDPVPDDAASIVAIEHILPKPHHCSKGEDCKKWQRQQRKIARLAKDLPIDINAATRLIVEPYYGQQPPHTAKSLPNMEPMPTPSIVASSDALGPVNEQNFRLSEAQLHKLRQRDPQENVRQYLNFQHLPKLQSVGEVNSPDEFNLASPEWDSPSSTRANAGLTDHLRALPKLTIPSNQRGMIPDVSAATLSAQRTVTPSILRNPPNFTSTSIDATLHGASQQPYSYENNYSLADYASPSDFYRSHELYYQTSPDSEVDLPVTAIPDCPIERENSQSVPPDMRFGHEFHEVAAAAYRPASMRSGNHRKSPSGTSQGNQPLRQVNEVVRPIDSLDDLNSAAGSGASHSGWMKKRKTTRMLRHEWEEHHFKLTGTQLAMYEDEAATQRNSKALEYIDVDDYAVACSSLASSSKLTAAFKKTLLKRKDTPQNEAAFAFSLIPSTNDQSGSERRNFFVSNGKSHHFAVKTRNERIDWMRELMLAKALKRGKDAGDSVHINGNMF